MPYTYEIIKEIKNIPIIICILEKELQKQNKKFKYIPKIKFNGINECFSQIDLKLVNKVINEAQRTQLDS